MNKKAFKLNWTKLDIIVVISVFFISLILTLCVYLIPSNNDDLKVSVFYDNHIIYETTLLPKNNESDPRYIILFKNEINDSYDEIYPTTDDKKFANNKLLLDDLVIMLSEGKVSIVKEESPNHICSRQGTISSPFNPPLVCMPNYVKISITQNSSNDDVIILG